MYLSSSTQFNSTSNYHRSDCILDCPSWNIFLLFFPVSYWHHWIHWTLLHIRQEYNEIFSPRYEFVKVIVVVYWYPILKRNWYVVSTDIFFERTRTSKQVMEKEDIGSWDKKNIFLVVSLYFSLPSLLPIHSSLTLLSLKWFVHSYMGGVLCFAIWTLGFSWFGSPSDVIPFISCFWQYLSIGTKLHLYLYISECLHTCLSEWMESSLCPLDCIIFHCY